jgi:ribosome assembly protein YihI (activator of Der GTPase)
MKDGVRACVKNVLAHIRVLAPSVPLEKLREDTNDDNYLESIGNAESKVEDLANFIAEKLDIHLPLLMTKLTVRFCSIWAHLSSL